MKTILTISIFILSSFLAFSQTGHWDSIPTKGNPGFRYDYGMAPIGDKQVLVFGGKWDYELGDTWLFNLHDSSWTKIDTPNSPSPRVACEMVQISKNRVMMHGGMFDWKMKSDTWIFDLDSMNWRQVITDSAGPATTRFGMTRYNDSLVFLTEGGITLGMGTIWYYNIFKEEWHLVWGFIPEDKTEPNVTQIADNVVLACGGYNSQKGERFGVYLWEHDSLNVKKRGLGASSTDIQHISNGICLLFGIGTYSQVTWHYNFYNDEWQKQNLLTQPQGRIRHKIAKIDLNKVLLYGGGSENSSINDTWTYTLDSVTFIQENAIEMNVSVYISNNNLVIEHQFEPSDINIEIYNLFGQLNSRYNPQYSTQEIIIPDIDLRSGCYFLRIITNNQAYNLKLIKN